MVPGAREEYQRLNNWTTTEIEIAGIKIAYVSFYKCT
jgi:hypothetical protein